MMTSRYLAGDEVVLSHIFKRENYGKFVKCPPFIAVVKKVDHTPTYGFAYTLAVGDETLCVCYWEADIDFKVEPYCNEAALWHVWGDQ